MSIKNKGVVLMSPEFRSFMTQELVDAGELIPHGSEYFEDMGGHLLHESNLDYYFEHYIKTRDPEELKDLFDRAAGRGN